MIAVILGYPLYWLGKLSTERYGLFELIQHAGTSIGLDNYRSVLHDEIFWRTLLRTVIFTAVIVGLTMAIGMAARIAARACQQAGAAAPELGARSSSGRCRSSSPFRSGTG